MSTELTTLNNLFADGGALAKQSAKNMKQLDALSKATDFLPRIQLYTKGKAIDKDLIEKGHYGIPRSGDQIDDLGKSIDVIPLALKAKAIDMSDPENLIISNDVDSEEFKRIEEMASTPNSGCAVGPTYLVYERSTGSFYEFFCGSKSAIRESVKINQYLPVTPLMIQENLTKEKEPRFAKPLTLGVQLLEKGNWTWHAPRVQDCLTPFDNLPDREELVKQIEKFLKKEDSGVETVTEETKSKRRR